jgi:protocatechuate 3,4-dioxygenase beta subunit
MRDVRRADRPNDVTRRQALTWLGATGLAAFAAACSGSRPPSGGSARASSASPTAAGGGTTSSGICVLSPEMTEGPFYIDGETVRRDITEGSPGLPLRLELAVVDATSCTPISGAAVDVWHADAGGNYSGVGTAGSSTTFLRGVQMSDAAGKVAFRTIYPGWYAGRATHIHLKVHVGGSVVHTGQLFFDEHVNEAVYARSPYRAHTGQRTLNAQDSIYASGGAQSILKLKESGTGYVGNISLGVQAG